MERGESVDHMMEDRWFFGINNNIIGESNSRIPMSDSDSTCDPRKQYSLSSIFEGDDSGNRSMEAAVKDEEEEDDEEEDPRMGDLIRQAMQHCQRRRNRMVPSRSLPSPRRAAAVLQGDGPDGDGDGGSNKMITRTRSALLPGEIQIVRSSSPFPFGLHEDVRGFDHQKPLLPDPDDASSSSFAQWVDSTRGRGSPQDMKDQIKFWARAVASNAHRNSKVSHARFQQPTSPSP
ncbi:hypothetical protein Dimus_012689 [Dionaea muscipula]